DTRTTFMIRNIPNKYTQTQLMEYINISHKGQYDFLYLRIDFINKCNVGYAFINFLNTDAIVSFAEKIVGKRWPKFSSEKICILSYANIQGRDALIEKFRSS
ncbi:RNA recognition motif 2, partial [Blyttiomyces helicus]